MEEKQGKYRVLARKYRPVGFKDLIGQDALVRTITNAIKNDRLAQAYILTGIRGVGKTTSARIIARALNCIGPDGNGQMTPNPCGVCKHCRDIENDCHIDVIEIDAASNTGVDNVREIIEGAKYSPLSARYKIYIIDEVHMLSKAAFNALLKTLEEPPEHLKFIFATTEIRKVPMTILSRCQRFDLKRIEENVLTDYLAKIADLEKVEADRAALELIAKAADGSVRDALSLLDQAIAHGNGKIEPQSVSEMVGLSDKTFLFKIYDKLMSGDMKSTLELVAYQYKLGMDPLMLAEDLLGLTHWLTCAKVIPESLQDDTLSETEKTEGKRLSDSLSMATLTRAWQILLKGFSEIKYSQSPAKSLDMLLVRLAYAAELPTPIELLKQEDENDSAQKKTENLTKAVQISSAVPTKKEPVPAVVSNDSPLPSKSAKNIQNIADIVALAQEDKEMLLSFNIANYVHPIELSFGKLKFSEVDGIPGDFCQKLRTYLKKKTGVDWNITTVKGTTGGQSVKEQAIENKKKMKENLSAAPLVQEVLKTFPTAQIETFNLHKTDEGIEPENDEGDFE